MNQQQQPKQSKLKTYGTITIVILAFVLIYFYMSGGSPAPSGTLVAGTSVGSIGSSELNLLNEVRSLKIDTSLFTDPAFLSLQDYSVAISPENVGRPNPFAPLPGEPVAAPSTGQSGSSATSQ